MQNVTVACRVFPFCHRGEGSDDIRFTKLFAMLFHHLHKQRRMMESQDRTRHKGQVTDLQKLLCIMRLDGFVEGLIDLGVVCTGSKALGEEQLTQWLTFLQAKRS